MGCAGASEGGTARSRAAARKATPSPIADPQGSGKPNQPLATVLFVHGGPWGRDSWGLNGSHQWLTSRGYAVLSVNYRGSTGFGKAFVNAGDKEWAGKMHGFARPENRIAFFAVAETFLAQHLGGVYQPIGNDFQGSSLSAPEGAAEIVGLTDALAKK